MIVAGELVLSASTVHSPTIHSGIRLAQQLRQRGIDDHCDATLKRSFIAASSRDAAMSGRLSHCSPLIIIDNVPPESIRAAAQDIASRASDVHVLAVGPRTIN